MCNGNCGNGCTGGCNSCGGYWKTVKVWQEVAGQNAAIRCTDCGGNPLPGCVCTIKKCGKFYSACSDENGWCFFKGVCPGCYTLTCTSAPAGYRTNCRSYCCCIYDNGCCKINGVNSSCFCLRCAKLPCCNTPAAPTCGYNGGYGYGCNCCNGAGEWGAWNSGCGGCGCQ
ncbi:MAG: prealbumin-like fold domain-containing protein [Oscillospiraceae bacterium]|nr:prealbumin-like fold domain-containing protein [Oscillospiraceae bacterium]